MSATSTAQSLAPGMRVHLVGIGGAGMSALAFLLLERGHAVSGSDLRRGPAAAALSAMGAAVAVGHAARHVDGADVVVTSTAVPESNPETARARALGLPVWHRARLLAELIGPRYGVLVTGTHGKTTTTAMTTVCLQTAGADPSFAIGGTLHGSGASAHHGSGDVFVAEADESDRSFLVFEPDCAVVTNVELDHHDTYADLGAVIAAIDAFLARRRGHGPALICADDPGAAAVAARAAQPVLTYGTHPDARLRADAIVLSPEGTRFRLRLDGDDLGPFVLRLPGLHNVRNGTAAAGAALQAGATPEAVRQGLASFTGAQRRFQRIGAAAGVQVVDSYDHHPTELRAVLAAAGQVWPSGRIVAVFQPHRYSRTAALGRELGEALCGADLAVVTDVYAAGEAPVPGVTGKLVADAAAAAGTRTHYVGGGGDLAAAVAALVRRGDVVLTLGAGDITELGPVLLRRLEGRRG